MSQPDTPALTGMSIGAVLDLLRPDFPDVTISKIRFLEAEGLVTPQRAASGYRRFTAYDCARLRFILTAQRDHYLPMKVIRAQLDAPAATGAEGAVSGVEGLPVGSALLVVKRGPNAGSRFLLDQPTTSNRTGSCRRPDPLTAYRVWCRCRRTWRATRLVCPASHPPRCGCPAKICCRASAGNCPE